MKVAQRGFYLFLMSVLLSACFPVSEKNTDDDTTQQKPAAQQVDISGVIQYQDRLYNQLGFINNNAVYKTLRNVSIALAQTDGEEIEQSLTNAVGAFSFSDVPVGDYLLRIKAQSTVTNGTQIQVFDTSSDLYVIEVPLTISEEQVDFEIDLTAQQRVGGIFNMLDVFYSAIKFVDDVSSGTVSVDDLAVFWQWGDSNGSYTCRADNISCQQGIYVLSDPYFSGDTDEYDDDVLLHEFAHHMESSLFLFDSPGGAHTLHSTALDLRLSWSEGMASAFGASVKHWLRQNDPGRLSIPNYVGLDLADYYIDTRGSSVNVAIDLQSASASTYHYSTNEVAVASSMLSLQSLTDIPTLWRSYWSALTVNSTADTLESFWDGFVGLNAPAPSDLSDWQSTLASRDILYQLDSLETNQSIASARTIDDTIHSLYRNHYTTDVDWHKVDVTSGITYQFETHTLRNGADTMLELYRADETLLASNDDAFDCELEPSGCSPLHDGANFSSLIEYTAGATETLYLKVQTVSAVYDDPTSYGYIGRYGTYQIQVMELP